MPATTPTMKAIAERNAIAGHPVWNEARAAVPASPTTWPPRNSPAPTNAPVSPQRAAPSNGSR